MPPVEHLTSGPPTDFEIAAACGLALAEPRPDPSLQSRAAYLHAEAQKLAEDLARLFPLTGSQEWSRRGAEVSLGHAVSMLAQVEMMLAKVSS